MIRHHQQILSPMANLAALAGATLLLVGCSVIGQGVQKVAAHFNGLTSPVSEREILLGNNVAPVLNPQVIARTSDGGFIMAGNGNTRTGGKVLVGGAARYDANGKELWRYFTTLSDALPKHSKGPVFFGAAPMQDGSTYLCGEMPHPPGSGTDVSWAMLAHVDRGGHLISEKLVTPSEKTAQKFYLPVKYLHTCVAWGDDVAILGTAEHRFHLAGEGSPPSQEDYYWILVIDAGENVKWEKLISFSEKLVPSPNSLQTFFDSDNMVLLPFGPNLLISATDGHNTDVLSLSAAGEIKANTQYVGDYRLVHPVVPDDSIQLWGRPWEKTLSSAITLNDRLEQVKRIDGNPKAQFIARLAFRLPDQSLCLFGINVPGSGYNGRSVVLHLDRELQHYQDFEPIARGNPFERGPYVDSGRLFAAAPIGDLSKFAVAMNVAVRNTPAHATEPVPVQPGFASATILDILKLK